MTAKKGKGRTAKRAPVKPEPKPTIETELGKLPPSSPVGGPSAERPVSVPQSLSSSHDSAAAAQLVGGKPSGKPLGVGIPGVSAPVKNELLTDLARSYQPMLKLSGSLWAFEDDTELAHVCGSLDVVIDKYFPDMASVEAAAALAVCSYLIPRLYKMRAAKAEAAKAAQARTRAEVKNPEPVAASPDVDVIDERLAAVIGQK
jgi:hypothetical protein